MLSLTEYGPALPPLLLKETFVNDKLNGGSVTTLVNLPSSLVPAFCFNLKYLDLYSYYFLNLYVNCQFVPAW